MKEEIYYIRGEMSSVIHAALADVTSDAYQQKTIRLIHEKKRPLRLSLALSLVHLSLMGMILFVLYLFGAHESFSIGAMLLVLLFPLAGISAIENNVEHKFKRRFLSQILRKDAIRPNMCVMCFTDLRYSDNDYCGCCGERLVPAQDAPDV